MSFHEFGAAINRQDWSFENRAPRDEKRYKEKIRDAVKDGLEDLVSDGSVITADPNNKKLVRVPTKSLELPDFRYGEPKEKIGSGAGDGQPQPGDPVPGAPSEGAGEGGGEEYYEASFTLEEIQTMVFEDLGLPNLRPKGADTIESSEVRYDDIRKKRTTTNLDLMRTAFENIRRNAIETGVARIGNISDEDFRVRTWEVEQKPKDSAVIIAMADISGSMGEFEKYVTRAFCWWTASFLRTKYPKVDIAFIAHDTQAYEVSEEQFFSRGLGGGTKCSSANQMALDMMSTRYLPDQYNVYPLHFSDGDNYSSDNAHCVELIQEMLERDISQYAYIQIGQGQGRESQLLSAYRRNLHDERFKGLLINRKEDVLTALKKVFPADTGGR
jgi:sporulation protein YhbH